MHDRDDLAIKRDAPAPIANRDCVIVLGNHYSHTGIGEHAYTLCDYFSGSHRVSVSEAIAPGKLNVLIDEFANPVFVEHMTKIKRAHPGTQYVIVATEFYTPLPLGILGISGTFNFFGAGADWEALSRTACYRLKLARLPSYMHRRYLGFVAALDIADVILVLHPGIADSIKRLARAAGQSLVPVVPLYPIIDMTKAHRLERLHTLPFGITMTGSLTPYRADVARRLVRTFTKAGYHAPVYKHLPFGPTMPFAIDTYPVEDPGFLFNLNPPKTRWWRFSSSMRILRAALLGQIPLVSKKFGDHEIETIAVPWENKTVAAQRLWSEGTLGRTLLIERFVADVERYNATARRKNLHVAETFRKAGIV